MRITMLAASVGNPFGQERVLQLSAQALRASGHDIEVITDHHLGPVPGTSRVVPLPGLSSLQPFSRKEHVENTLRLLSDALTRFRPDLIHFIDFLDERVVHVGADAAPVVLTAHTVAPSCPASTRQSAVDTYCTRTSGYGCLVGNYKHGCLSYLKTDLHRAHAIFGFQRRKKAFMERAAAVFAISPFVERCLIDDGWPRDRVRLLANPVELPSSAPPKGKNAREILVCSRLTHLKGVDTVLRAAASLEKTDFVLRIIGDGSEKKSLIDLAEQLGISRQVIWMGSQPSNMVSEWMMSAGIFVQANRGPEGFGMAVAEAMGRGCAVVVSDVPMLPEFVRSADGKSEQGLIFKKESVSDLAEKLASLIGNSEQISKLGNAAQTYIRSRYSVQMHLDATLANYKAVLGAAPASVSGRGGNALGLSG